MLTINHLIFPDFVSLVPKEVFVVVSGLVSGRTHLYALPSTDTTGSKP